VWTYDAGSLVEQGSILLSKIEPTWSCSDLDQPYLGKCVILILSTHGEHDDPHHDHDDAEEEEGTIRRRMTQGIILNRPSDLRLDSEGNVLVVGDGTSSSDEGRFDGVILEEFEDNTSMDLQKEDQWRMFFGGEVSSTQDYETATLENDEEDDDDDDDSDQDDDDDSYDHEEDEEEDTIILCLHNISSPAARQVSEQISPINYKEKFRIDHGM